ncbi:MAG: hypothetical protein QOE51_358 [Actinoplanes sp.]|nr:hypothetical protein [Actinoplanes sp.]
MRYQPIRAASSDSVPFMLRGPKSVRSALSAAVAGAIGLVPVIMLASPAQADSSYIAVSASMDTVAEGALAAFDVTVQGQPDQIYKLDFSGTATQDTDFTAPDAMTFDTATSVGPITVQTLSDAMVEGDETLTLTLTNQNDDADTVSATVHIVDTGYTLTSTPVNETAVTPAVGNTPAVQRKARVTATLSGPLSQPVTIPLTVGAQNDTARSDMQVDDPKYRDYDLPGEPAITIPAGQTSGYFDITLYDDSLDEDDSQFITVSGDEPTGASPTTQSAGTTRVTIIDDDATPTVSIGGAGLVSEGSALGFPLTLSGASERPVTVKVSTANGVTSGDNYGAVAPGDYTALVNQTVAFPQYLTSAAAIVTTNQDGVTEASPETLSASISQPTNATLGASTMAPGGITDTDPAPTIDLSTAATGPVDDVFATEGASGDVSKPITVTLSGPSTIPVKVNYTFGGSSATLGTDYKATNGSVTIPAGSRVATIPLSIVGDTVYEPSGETFTVTLSSPNASVDFGGQTVRTFTIADDDMVPTYSIAAVASVPEGDAGTTMAHIPVTISGPTNADVVFNVSAVDGTGATGAVEGGTNIGLTAGADDYNAPAATVTIPAGSTTADILVPVNGDTVFEKDQTFTVGATPVAMQNVTGTDPVTSVVTISKDDAAPKMTFNSTSGTEGTTIRALGTIVGTSEYPYTVNLAWAGTGTAPASSDDYSLSSPLTTPYMVDRGATGALSGPIADVFIEQDTVDEPVELLGITATEATVTPIGFVASTGSYRLNDDPGDLPPALSIGDESIKEDEGSVLLTISEVFDGDTTATQQVVTVPWATENRTAGATRYTKSSGVATIAPGHTSTTISIPVIDDNRKELDQDFVVKLGTPSPAGTTLKKGIAEVTIHDDGDTAGATPVTLKANKGTVVGVGKVTLSGKTAAGDSVQLWAKPYGNAHLAVYGAPVIADSDGDFSFNAPLTKNGIVFAAMVGNTKSPEVTVYLQQDPMISGGAAGRGVVTLKVTANPKTVGGNATLQAAMPNGTWATVATGKIGVDGTWTGTVRGQKSGTTRKYRGWVAGNGVIGLLSGNSAAQQVRIR